MQYGISLYWQVAPSSFLPYFTTFYPDNISLMETFLLPYGLFALFILSFLAATVLPLGSEWFLIVLLLNAFDPVTAVTIASTGNFLGACTTYLLGQWGSVFCQKSLLRIKDDQLERARKFYKKYGMWSLLLSWVPIIGDPLCFLAGIFKTPFLSFAALVFFGKASRYAALAYLTLYGKSL